MPRTPSCVSFRHHEYPGLLHLLRLVRAPAALLLVLAQDAAGQQVRIGGTYGHMADAGRNIAHDGCGGSYFGGIGPSLSFLTRGGKLAFLFSSRFYLRDSEPECPYVDAIDQPLPPENGIIITEDRHTLQASRFTTTDARVTWSPVPQLAFGVGVGAAWREGLDVPYGVGTAELQFTRRRWQLAFGAEAYAFRVATDRIRFTYENSALILVEDLPRERSLSPALVLTVTLRLGVL